MHEFLHAWGFKHEQSRPDRDQYINVNLENTDIGKNIAFIGFYWFSSKFLDSQFVKMTDDWIDTAYPYELQSVMHYWSGLNYTRITLVIIYDS